MTKDDVLALLEQADAPVSGEQMCKTLGLTRAAVWKAIEALRADGYEIEAATRRGYFLCTCPLTKSALEKRLAGQFPTEKLIVLPEVDSTNNYLKTLAANGAPDGTAVLSLKQTAGRGRRGRSFLSEPGGLYLSFLMRPQEPAEALLHLTALAGLCVCTAVKQVTGMQAGIKWPNDIIMSGKKVCGILTEMSAQFDYVNHIVVGIGINVQNKTFPKDIESVATSLFIETKEHYHRAELVERIWEAFEHYYEIFLQTEDLSGLVNEYNSHLVNMHQQVKVLDPKEPFEGKAMGITPKGELIVDTWESRKLVSTGEVSVRGIYGYV